MTVDFTRDRSAVRRSRARNGDRRLLCAQPLLRSSGRRFPRADDAGERLLHNDRLLRIAVRQARNRRIYIPTLVSTPALVNARRSLTPALLVLLPLAAVAPST
jgi:hypothetical protein